MANPIGTATGEDDSAEDAPTLVPPSPHVAPQPLHVSLRRSYTLVRDRLAKIPISPLSFPSPDLPDLASALALCLLSSPQPFPRHLLVLLHSTSPLSYRLLSSTLSRISHDLYPFLLPLPRSNLPLLLPLLFRVHSPSLEPFLLSLLRRPYPLLPVLSHHLDLLASSSPLVLSSALFSFLRLLCDHHHLHSVSSFCVRLLRSHLRLCLSIGRDLVRLLHDVAFIPDLKLLWKDLLLHGVPDFPGLHAIYSIRTPSHFHLLRVSPEMESWTRFLLTEVKWGSEKRHLHWFARRFLAQESTIVDLIRFVCCAHHPSNEVLRSGVFPRWVFVGWLLGFCKRTHLAANAKLALFYDWMFFHDSSGNIMDVEPAMLLMVNSSVPEHAGFASALLEFLLILVDNYDVERKDAIATGVRAAFVACVRKGVVRSLDPLVSCDQIPSILRNRLRALLPGAIDPQVPISPESKRESHLLRSSERVEEDSSTSSRCTPIGGSSILSGNGVVAERIQHI